MSNIFVIDDIEPEDIGMLQALYSRSNGSVMTHIEKMAETGSSKFMESYYVGYGHQSIGDCANTTLFIEGVSMLAAKAIQDNGLYSGQESSTRYIDFSKQPIVDPVGTDESKEVLDNWIAFYTKHQDTIQQHLKLQYPIKSGQKESVWEKAIAARTFDILRGFLPAGATTQLSWTTNLRQAYDKLSKLQSHPLKELRDIAHDTLEKLRDKYPSSFSHKERVERDAYYQANAEVLNYSADMMEGFEIENGLTIQYLSPGWETLDDMTEWDKNLLATRPNHVEIPKYFDKYGSYRVRFLLDYGSFRDIQRHRSVTSQIPMLTDKNGFNQWYIDQLPAGIVDEAMTLLEHQSRRIDALGISEVDKQYYHAMGNNVQFEMTGGLSAMAYIMELRSSVYVHPTLRNIIMGMVGEFRVMVPEMRLYIDESKHDFDIGRGLQDITKV